MSDPRLHRLMSMLDLYRKGQLTLEEEKSGRSRTNLAGLAEMLDEEGFLDEVINDWQRYLTLECELEEAFFGRRKAGIGSHAKRWGRAMKSTRKKFLFAELREFEQNPDKYGEVSINERLITLLQMKSRDIGSGVVSLPWEDVLSAGGEKEIQTLLREYRMDKRRRRSEKIIKESQEI